MTLNKVVIELGLRDFISGVTFVACSRARSIRDIAFRSNVTLERLSNLGGLAKVQEDIVRRGGLIFRDALDIVRLSL